MVICQLCKYKNIDLTEHIFSQHQLKIEQYKILFKSSKIKDFFYERICKICQKKYKNTQNQGNICSKICRRNYEQQKKLEKENKPTIQCKLCNIQRQDLTKHIIKDHQISTLEYRNKFPNSALMIENIGINRASHTHYKGRKSWNVGLTKENDNRLKVSGDNIKKAIIEKNLVAKRKQTCLERYGVDNPFKRLEYQKTKMIEKYGVSNIMHSEKIRKRYFEKQLKYLRDCSLIDILNFDYKQKDKFYNFKCKLCGAIFAAQFSRQYIIRCRKCYDKYHSLAEQDIRNFLIEHNISCDTNNRSIIKAIDSNVKLEIDILIPDKNIGIEYDGLKWHTTEFVNKDMHIYKTEECNKQNIFLIHIFEDEWLNKQDIVKSRLRSILKLPVQKIFARKCIVKEVSFIDSEIFLNNNHIQGSCLSKIRLGLYYNNQLVSLMTFGKPRNSISKSKNNFDYELLRFCNLINTNIIGGASKLFQHFQKYYIFNTIISYADRRWSKGDLYYNLNFKLERITKPNYFYVINGKRCSRLEYQKHKLISKGYDKKLSEEEIMLNLGYYRIYDCGNYVFIYKK